MFSHMKNFEIYENIGIVDVFCWGKGLFFCKYSISRASVRFWWERLSFRNVPAHILEEINQVWRSETGTISVDSQGLRLNESQRTEREI